MALEHQFISGAQAQRMPGRSGVLYQLDKPPFTLYVWNGFAMVALPNQDEIGDYAGGFNIAPTPGDLSSDDTVDFQSALFAGEGGVVSLQPTKRYRITDSLVFPKGRTRILGNNAAIHVDFGVNYGKPLFKNDGSSNSVEATLKDFRVFGNCLVLQMLMLEDNPDAGIKFFIDRLFFNTNDGARRAGTGLVVADQADFVVIENSHVWNADLGMQLGSISGNRRSCTQVTVRQAGFSYVNATAVVKNVDKAFFQGVDTARCNSGFTFDGQSQRIKMLNCHVEGLAAGGPAGNYTVGSTRVPAAAQGVGLHFSDSVQSAAITVENFSCYDLAGDTGGNAKAGIYIGRCTGPLNQVIELINPKIAKTMAGSANYKPLDNVGRFYWKGPFGTDMLPNPGPYTTELRLSQNGFNYIDMVIEDTANQPPCGPNLLPGETPYSLYDVVNGGATAPTIAEGGANLQRQDGFSITWTAAYFLCKFVNLPYGWITFDITGYKGSGSPELVVALNGYQEGGQPPELYTEKLAVQFDSGSDRERRWRISFFNTHSGVQHRVGIRSNGAGSVFMSNIAVYRGFSQPVPPRSPIDVVAALPPISTSAPNNTGRWLGKTVWVRQTGSADALYICRRSSTGVLEWAAK